MKTLLAFCTAVTLGLSAFSTSILADAAVSTGVGDAACPCWPVGHGGGGGWHGHGGGWHGHGRR